MNVTIQDVTPQMAEVWLNQNKSNRALRPGIVEKYAADMVAGKWTQTIDPIGFYKDGDVCNGQHRLFALVESDTTQKFIVVHGIDRAAGLNIDTGFLRTLIDNARISGSDDGLSPALITAARAIALGNTQGTKSDSYTQKLAMVNEYREAAAFAASNVRRTRYLCGGAVLGAVGRAWLVEADKDRLARFCDVLASGLHENDGETPATALRNYLLKEQGIASTSTMWRDTFLKAMNAVYYFMRAKKLTVLKAVADEAYPLKKGKKK